MQTPVTFEDVAAAPESGAHAVSGWVRLVALVKNHPLMAVVSVLGTLATFTVGTVRVAGLLIGGGLAPIGDAIPSSELAAPPGAEYEYVEVSDATGQISVDVPTAWANVLGDGWHAQGLPPLPDGRAIGPGLNAAPSVEAWRSAGEFDTPGVFVGASREILKAYSPVTILQRVSFDGCRTTGGDRYTNDDFTGATVVWSCPRSTQWRVLAATPTESRAYLVYVQVKLTSAADAEAYNRVMGTFEADLDA